MEYSFGTDEYIEHVLDKYSAMLIKLAFTYVKNSSDAEDIVQDVFIKLIKNTKGFASHEHEKAWLLRVTINSCKNYLKSSYYRLSMPLDENLSYNQKEPSVILEAVLKLPAKYRTVVHLHYYENYSIEELAKLLHKNPATIGTWLSRGRGLLRTTLQGGLEFE